MRLDIFIKWVLRGGGPQKSSQIFGEHILLTKRIYIFMCIQTAYESDMNEIVYKSICERMFLILFTIHASIRFAFWYLLYIHAKHKPKASSMQALARGANKYAFCCYLLVLCEKRF